ncbi:6712_t:CDS:2 [Acaulospora colombiana]|uniref:6712_t:CDS:1 n=1 Tax=Acaulospora colombiana TaxID=27376 RepID=A0ACA9KRW6_9GLOM|nr:6712_t:CDS:2 [Acaulospora colombiana]
MSQDNPLQKVVRRILLPSLHDGTRLEARVSYWRNDNGEQRLENRMIYIIGQLADVCDLELIDLFNASILIFQEEISITMLSSRLRASSSPEDI